MLETAEKLMPFVDKDAHNSLIAVFRFDQRPSGVRPGVDTVQPKASCVGSRVITN